MDYKNRKISITLIYTALLILGIISVIRIPKEDAPERSMTGMSIMTYNFGKTPEFMDRYITSIIEGELLRLDFIEDISSNSRESISFISFQVSGNINRSMLHYYINNACSIAYERFPENTSYPDIRISYPEERTIQDSNPFEIIIYRENTKRKQLYDYYRTQLYPSLAGINGIRSISVQGRPVFYEKIERDFEKDIFPIITQRQRQLGFLLIDNKQLPVHNFHLDNLMAEFDRLEGLNIIKRSIKEGIEDNLEEISMNRNDAIIITISREEDSNIIRLKNSIDDTLKNSNIEYFFTIDTSIRLYDQIYFFAGRLGLSLLLINIILLLFYKGYKIILLFDITILLNVFITINIMYNLGVTINYYSIAAFLISFGVIIDNAIIVYEYIFKEIIKKKDLSLSIKKGISKASHIVIATTITNICIFIPFVYINPDLKNQLFSFALTIMISMLVSIIVSFTLIPVFIITFDLKNIIIRKWTRYTNLIYRIILKRILHIPFIILIVLLISGYYAYDIYRNRISQIFTEYRAITHEDYLTINIGTRENTNPDLLMEAVRDYNNILYYAYDNHDFIKNILLIKEKENVAYKVYFHDKDDLRPLSLKRLCSILGNYYDKLEFSITGLSSQYGMSPSIWRGIRKNSIRIAGYDYDYLMDFAHNLAKQINTFNEVLDVQVGTRRSISIEEAMIRQRPSLEHLDFNSYISFLNRNLNQRTIRQDNHEFRIKSIGNIYKNDFLEFPADLDSGMKVIDLFELDLRQTPLSIQKDNGRYTLRIEYTYRGERERTCPIRSRIQANTLFPAGIEDITDEAPGTGFFDYRDARNIYWYIALTLLIVYCITTIMVQSYIDSLLVVLTIVFTFSVIVFTVYFMQIFLDINAILAFIILTGIVINGSLMIFFNLIFKKAGKKKLKAHILKCSGESYISVLLTTLTTIFGFLPFAIFLPDGFEINRWYTMATIMIIGVLGGMIYSLFIYPCIFYLSRLLNK